MNLERSCDVKTPLEVGKWYSVPLYPFRIGFKVFNLPVLLPAHEDGAIFGFPVWHYHLDVRFIHKNALIKILRQEYGIKKYFITKFIYCPNKNAFLEYTKVGYFDVACIEAWECGVTDKNQIIESWYGFLADRFALSITNQFAPYPEQGKSADYSKIKWEDQMCRFTDVKISRKQLHDVLVAKSNFAKERKYCGVCPHKGINLEGIESNANGIKVCPAHGGRWKIKDGKISLETEEENKKKVPLSVI